VINLPNLSYYDSSGTGYTFLPKPYSDRHGQADRRRLAEILLKKEVIFREDLEHIFGKRAFEDSNELASAQTIAPEDSNSLFTDEKDSLPLGNSDNPSAGASTSKIDEK